MQAAAKKKPPTGTTTAAGGQTGCKRRALVEFTPRGSFAPSLGVLVEPRKRSWLVATADGATTEVPLEAMAYVDSAAPGWVSLDLEQPSLSSALAACAAAAATAAADPSVVSRAWQALRDAEPTADAPRRSLVVLADLFLHGGGSSGSGGKGGSGPGGALSTGARYAAHVLIQSPAGRAHFAPSAGPSEPQLAAQPWVRARPPVDVAAALAAQGSAHAARDLWEQVAVALAARVQARREQPQPQQPQQDSPSLSGPNAPEDADAAAVEGPALESLVALALLDLEALAVEFDPSGQALPKPLQALNPSIADDASDASSSPPTTTTTRTTTTTPTVAELPGGFAAGFLGAGALAAWPCDARGAFGLLVALGVLSRHHALSLARSGLPHALPWRSAVLAAQATLLAHPPPDPFSPRALAAAAAAGPTVNGQRVVGVREDLTHMLCYAIDSADTYEVDDAISAERLDAHGQPWFKGGNGNGAGDGDGDDNGNGAGGRVRYWVHTADASRWLPHPSGCALAAEACRRQTSLYLPHGKQPMLPAALVAEAMALAPPHPDYPPPYGDGAHPSSSSSLGGGGGGPAPEAIAAPAAAAAPTRLSLSVGFELDASTGALNPDSVVVCAATVRRAMRLSYDECDDMLHLGLGGASEPDWALGCLEQAATARRAWRKRQCPAFMEQLPFLEVKAWPVDNRLLPGLPSSLAGDFEWRASAQPAGASECRSGLLVTELMVASGEAVGLLGRKHGIALPYRSQAAANGGGAGGAPSPAALQEELAALDAVSGGDARCRAYRLRKYMGKGATTPKPGKHYSLGLDQYGVLCFELLRFLPVCFFVSTLALCTVFYAFFRFVDFSRRD
jgi:uncharacterized membrane protein YgcG